ncbi:hypothetical protein DAPPUDRAFT_220308 [Daphnia pulex]|uniref:Uncharacterized protein n=1 Tax=Daphnia pulex TaxID=6669 RepID=E9FSD2_DAPPU|nr:hypothetical protein DAPPUDRAFT_220308 [Daphnia pulex]|eukprot:EFX89189.1 hypothetical protein DAPPUDRAFT_220308 [Daphnia pulex]
MDLLFAGLIALGVAVAVVVILKSLCFLSECLSTRCNHPMLGSRMPLDYAQAMAVAPARLNSGRDVQHLGGIGQRFPEGLYVICVDSSNNAPKFVVNHHQQQHATAALETSEPDVESPPTYEEAMSLIHPDGRQQS